MPLADTEAAGMLICYLESLTDGNHYLPHINNTFYLSRVISLIENKRPEI